MFSEYLEIVQILGYRGPILLFFITILVLQKQALFLYIYLFSFFVNDLLNKVLKIWIQEKRPYGYDHNYNMEKPFIGHDKYGMPSGHSQSVSFSLFFTWIVTGSKTLFLGEFILCLMTLYQRWNQKKHTIQQLIVGFLVGSLFAFSVYYMAEYIQYERTRRDPQWDSLKTL
jgi:membrane-associated phospholipid phosphatase